MQLSHHQPINSNTHIFILQALQHFFNVSLFFFLVYLTVNFVFRLSRKTKLPKESHPSFVCANQHSSRTSPLILPRSRHWCHGCCHFFFAYLNRSSNPHLPNSVCCRMHCLWTHFIYFLHCWPWMLFVEIFHRHTYIYIIVATLFRRL